MMIWKFAIEFEDEQEVTMPVGAKILSAQMQGRSLCIWAIVEEKLLTMCPRRIRVVGTGHPMPHYGDYVFIDTVQPTPGLVFHVFEHVNRDIS